MSLPFLESERKKKKQTNNNNKNTQPKFTPTKPKYKEIKVLVEIKNVSSTFTGVPHEMCF